MQVVTLRNLSSLVTYVMPTLGRNAYTRIQNHSQRQVSAVSLLPSGLFVQIIQVTRATEYMVKRLGT